MPNMKTPSGTGSAPIVKVGHTASTRFGTNPDAQVKGGKPPVRDLKISTSGK